MSGLIYLDYNGTTPVDPRVGEAVQPFVTGGLEGAFANPSSAYAPAAGTKAALVTARASVAALLGCDAGEVLFCSGGTESINHVVKGVVMEAWKRLGRGGAGAAVDAAACGSTGNTAAPPPSPPPRRPHVVVSAVEHVAVLNAVAWCCDPGAAIPGASAAASASGMGFCDVSVVPVGRDGVVSVADVVAAVTPATVLVSVMLANNETGAVQPVAAIAKALAAAFPARRAFAGADASVATAADAPLPLLLHSDASQCLGKMPVAARELGVDFCTVAGHKLYAPKGCGATYVRAAAKPLLPVFMHGAGQEGGMRAGTENLALCAALGAGAAVCKEHEDTEPARLAGLRNRLAAAIIRGCMERGLPAPAVHGPLAAELAGAATSGSAGAGGFTSLPNTLSIALPGAFAAAAVLALKTTVAVSAGAACHASAVLDPRRAHVSHVLAAMGIPSCIALCTLRLSLGRWSTADEVDRAASLIVNAAADVRRHESGATLAAIAESEGCGHAYAAPAAGAVAISTAAAVGGAASALTEAVAAPPAAAARLQTEHVFLADTHQYETPATVLAVLPVDAAGAQLTGADGTSRAVGPPVAGASFAVITSATVAHPQGGGQPADRGIIVLDSADAEPVFVFTSVRLSSGLDWDISSPSPVAGAAVLHYGSFVPRAALSLATGASGEDLAAAADSIGEKGLSDAAAAAPWPSASAASAIVSINRPHRRLCARLHSGGHILDLAVKLAYDKWEAERGGTGVERLVPGKGYHFADGPNVEYEGSVPPEMRDWLVAEINARVAALIASGTKTAVVSVPQEADALATFGLGPRDCAHLPPGRPVRVVMVGSLANPCPCGGTHVRDAAELRALTATKITVKKGRTKVSYTVAP